MNPRRSIRKSRKSRKTRKSRKASRVYHGGKSDKEKRKEAKAKAEANAIRMTNKIRKMNEREAAEQNASRANALQASQQTVEAFSDYAGYHETESREPQETGASLRNISIQPTNPVFSF
jgi:hypothetical protein